MIYPVDCDIQLLNNWSLMSSHRIEKKGGQGGSRFYQKVFEESAYLIGKLSRVFDIASQIVNNFCRNSELEFPKW